MPLYNPASQTVPVGNSATAATAGTSGTYARGDHVHPRYNFDATDAGFLAWNYDIALGTGSFALPGTGLTYVMKVQVPVACTVTNIVVYLSVIGVTLTAGQSFVALYDGSKNKLSTSADQAATFAGTTGFKSIPLSVAQAISPGSYFVVVWANGSTMPSFRAAFSSASANTNLSAANSRWATADSSITTSGPATLGTLTASASSVWVGLN